MFILASSSVTRITLLQNAGLRFTSEKPDLDETLLHEQHANLPATQLALTLAGEKSKAVSALHKNQLVVGADQTLHLNQKIFHKPKSIEEARKMLLELRGQTHHLTTAISCHVNQHQIWHDYDQANMTVRGFSDTFLENYLKKSNNNSFASAGAYQLEAQGIQIFEKIEGDYFTILGFPLLKFLEFLRKRQLLDI